MKESEKHPVAKGQPLHLQVYEYLKDRILQGKIPCGSKILESKISEELQVSRSPVREAIRMLCNDELLVANGNGIVVNPMSFEDTVEVYECRIVMESFAARLAAARIDKKALDQLETYIGNVASLHKEHSPENYTKIIDLNSQFHNLIVLSSGHKRLRKLIENNSALAALSRANEFFIFDRNDDYVEEHKSIWEALTRHDGLLAEEQMRIHIQHDLDFFKKSNLR